MRTPAKARSTILLGLLLGIVLCCGGQLGCTQASCEASVDPYASFYLACGPTDLSKVEVSGPCAPSDAGTGPTEIISATSINIMSLEPGTCHLALTFATGFTYDAEVAFVRRPGACGGTVVLPTQMSFNVDNPPETCLVADAGAGGS